MKANNKELIHSFYTSFAKGNVGGMVNCYHENIVFNDPAFGTLKGEEVKNMWRMLLARSKGSTIIEFNNIEATNTTGKACWQATYTYGSKKRKVVNEITASFEFLDGKIIKHTDSFNLWNWSKQALGISGYLLGWSSFMKNKIQKKTNTLLNAFISSSKNME